MKTRRNVLALLAGIFVSPMPKPLVYTIRTTAKLTAGRAHLVICGFSYSATCPATGLSVCTSTVHDLAEAVAKDAAGRRARVVMEKPVFV